MKDIRFTIFVYYRDPLVKNCIPLGLLVHDLSTSEKHFHITIDYDDLAQFDEEVDIGFVKAYVNDIKTEVENLALTATIEDYIKPFVNEFRFTEIVDQTVTKYP